MAELIVVALEAMFTVLPVICNTGVSLKGRVAIGFWLNVILPFKLTVPPPAPALVPMMTLAPELMLPTLIFPFCNAPGAKITPFCIIGPFGPAFAKVCALVTDAIRNSAEP